MFPTLRNRLIIVAAAIIGGIVWCWAVPSLQAADHSPGPSLTTANGGAVHATVMLLVIGLPAIVLGLIASATGNPLSGLFAAGAALCALGGAGGSIQGWLHRPGVTLPGDFGWLALEVWVWYVGVVMFLLVAIWLHRRLAEAAPALSRQPHFGGDLKIGLPKAPALVPGAITAVIGHSHGA